jgi:hypothetical protein
MKVHVQSVKLKVIVSGLKLRQLLDELKKFFANRIESGSDRIYIQSTFVSKVVGRVP